MSTNQRQQNRQPAFGAGVAQPIFRFQRGPQLMIAPGPQQHERGDLHAEASVYR